MQGSVPSPAFLSPCPQEHDRGWWHPLSLSQCCCWGALPAPVPYGAEVQQNGAGEGVLAAWLCSVLPRPSTLLVSLLLPSYPQGQGGPFPTPALPASLAADPPAL